MKICWGKLEGMMYISKRDEWRKKTSYFIYRESCEVCGEPYLTKKNKPSDFCGTSCQNRTRRHTKESKEKNRQAHLGLKVSEETKKKISEAIKGENHPFYGKRGEESHWYGRKHSEETKEKIRKSHTGKKLSKEHRKNLSMAKSGKNNPLYGKEPWNKGKVGVRGEKHWSWNPNLTDEERQNGRNYPEYKEWRSAIYERDGYTCQKCGIGGGLNAHHIESYRCNPEVRTKLSNGITLCEECHKDFHHHHGRGNNTKEQLEEWMNKR